MRQIMEYCAEPKSIAEILEHLGLRDRKNLTEVYIVPMMKDGLLAMTEPDMPTSKHQKYVSVIIRTI